ncbi:hypothetical protein QVD17_07949 [Tagetes erecta]|uniref:Uncharacterized protein n=1 Tax=Tagetes erecta TaxID=13708 RepID=A0AAD8NX82_TARER|nr:hypothetical protein QVD17_07949 [Tagetes erecta]
MVIGITVTTPDGVPITFCDWFVFTTIDCNEFLRIKSISRIMPLVATTGVSNEQTSSLPSTYKKLQAIPILLYSSSLSQTHKQTHQSITS